MGPYVLNTIAITPKSEDKYVVKVVNWSEFHLSEMTLLQNPYFSKHFAVFRARLLKSRYLILPFNATHKIK